MKAYAIADMPFIVDEHLAGEKRYVLRLRDLPPDQKPRERMLSSGAGTLSSAELLAVILQTGTTKEEVLSMANRVLREYGERSLASAVNPAQMSEDLGIPITKAMQIVACAELGRRFFRRGGAGSAVIRTSRDVFELLADMRSLPKEHLRGLYLNNHHKVIHDEVISIGTIDANIIHPREVFRPALEYCAVAVVLAHNHPSGSLQASDADIAITNQLVEAGRVMGIQLLDHVIIAQDGYASVPVSYE